MRYAYPVMDDGLVAVLRGKCGQGRVVGTGDWR